MKTLSNPVINPFRTEKTSLTASIKPRDLTCLRHEELYWLKRLHLVYSNQVVQKIRLESYSTTVREVYTERCRTTTKQIRKLIGLEVFLYSHTLHATQFKVAAITLSHRIALHASKVTGAVLFSKVHCRARGDFLVFPSVLLCCLTRDHTQLCTVISDAPIMCASASICETA